LVKQKHSQNRQIKDYKQSLGLFAGYDAFVKDLKERIRKAQLKAGLAVNSELVQLYWEIGSRILIQEREKGWGAKIVDKLANDLKSAFPKMKGFSARNLRYMKAFAESYPDQAILQQVAAKLPWFHNCLLMDKIKNEKERKWYAQQTIQNGWSRTILELQINNGLYNRHGKVISNFDHTLPVPQSDLARQILKDPYNFDFLTLDSETHERDIERGLVEHMRQFLLELGVGFAFVGSQYHLDIGGEDYYIDLLFYHLHLRCYVIIELKAKEFQSEFAGKINLYLSAVDVSLRHPDDKPSIGIILCKTKNRVVAEYALRDINKPIGIAEYKTTELLPENLRGSLPTIEELEQTLADIPDK